MGLTIQPRPRSFREGLFKFRSTPFGALPTEADLARTIRGGLSGTGMGMFTHLSDDEVRSVIEYLKSFSRRWRKAENYAPPMQLPDPPSWLNEPQQNLAHAHAFGNQRWAFVHQLAHPHRGAGQARRGLHLQPLVDHQRLVLPALIKSVERRLSGRMVEIGQQGDAYQLERITPAMGGAKP